MSVEYQDRRSVTGVYATRLLLTLGLCLAPACKSSEQPAERSPTDDSTSPSTARVAEPLGAGSDHLRSTTEPSEIPEGSYVFIDSSASMRGYAEGSQTSLESVFNSVFQALSAQGVLPTNICTIGDSWPPDCNRPAEPSAFLAPNLYRATESRLADSLAPIPEELIFDEAGQRRLSQVDQRRISIFITDGVEAAPHPTGGQQSLDAPGACLPGPDVFCMQRALLGRVRQGYGVWLVVLTLPFDGRLYAERGLDDRLFGRVGAHMETLREDSQLSHLSFAATRLRTNRQGLSSYQYRGIRPLVLLILSRDLELGRQLSSQIESLILTERAAEPAGWVRSLELAPYQTGRYRFHSLTRVGQGEQLRALMPVGNPRRDQELGLAAAFTCQERGGAPLELAVVQEQPATPQLPLGLRENMTLRLESAGLPERAVLPPRASPDRLGIYLSGVNCGQLPSGDSRWNIELHTNLEWEPPSDGDTWWREWSAHTTWEMPERIYRFTDLVEALLAASAWNSYLQDRATVLVRKP